VHGNGTRVLFLFPPDAPMQANIDFDGIDFDDEPTSQIRPITVEEDTHPTRRELRAAIDFFSRVPRLAISQRDLSLLPLDHRDGFLVSLVDGVSTIEMILDVCAMPFDEAVAALANLVERRILVTD
jgi:hypothetical protein